MPTVYNEVLELARINALTKASSVSKNRLAVSMCSSFLPFRRGADKTTCRQTRSIGALASGCDLCFRLQHCVGARSKDGITNRQTLEVELQRELNNPRTVRRRQNGARSVCDLDPP